MIIKNRTIPLHILQMQALIRRLPTGNKKRPEIEEDYAKLMAGYRGEQSLDYHLSFLSKEKFDILHNLRLENEYAFQIDTLILSPQFIVVLEIKNLSGTLFFDKDSNQFIRTINDKEEGFQNPLIQVKRQCLQLKRWMEDRKLKPITIEYLVVISNNSTILKTSRGNSQLFKKVIHAQGLPEKIAELENSHHQNVPYCRKDTNKLIRKIIQSHTPLTSDFLKKYGISSTEIIKGVQCSKCESFNVIRVSSKWYCPTCNTFSNKAHVQSILDYLLLINLTISNSQCRDFLGLQSRKIAQRLLVRMNLPQTGTTKQRIYHRPDDWS